MRAWVATLLVFLLVACSERRVVNLAFGAGNTLGVGFRCKDDLGHFLVLRALDRERNLRFSLLVDFIGLGGLPTCRTADIANFCQSHACAPLADPARLCIDLEVSLAGDQETAVQALAALLKSLDGRVVTDDAPHAPVIIRAVASAQPCSELPGGTTPDPLQLVGCATSCPVQLESVEGDILLDLPTLSDQCAASVVACATGTLSP